MKMNKISKYIAAGAILAVLTVLPGSCTAARFPIQDGYYSAEAAEFDEFGWKEFVTIGVSSGQIILVEYDAFNASGFVKSWDMDYMRIMNAEDGTYPNAFTRYYGEKLLSYQGTRGVDILAGATHSYHSFLQLAEAALENARLGDVATRFVRLSDPDAE